MLGLARFLISLAVLTAVLGYGVYMLSVSLQRPAEDARADAIVVLTGAHGARVETALRLLEEGRGERLLISGVSGVATDSDIRSMAPPDAARFDCCVDLDRDAADTAGNARETARWVREHDYQSVLLVTHAFHMPRARLELNQAAPEIEFRAYPVGSWREPGLQRSVVEYAKFLVILGRAAAARLRTEFS